MEEQANQSGEGPRDTRLAGRHGARRKALRLIIFCVAAAAVVAGAASCGDKAPDVSVTVLPSPRAEETTTPEAVVTPEATITPEATAPVGPTPEVEDESEGWLTYTNDVYGYEFRYPPEATVRDAETDKICVNVEYELGYVTISASVNRDFSYVICGRTSRAYEGPDREETLLIDGRTYTAQGFEEHGPGDTLNYHNELLVVNLDDGTRIEYGPKPSETATFEDYLGIRDNLLRIVQSYRELP